MRQSGLCVVLGAGLMGRLLAHSLARQGLTVQVFDAGDGSGQASAAHVAASMLAPLAESVVAERPVVDMGFYSLERWPELLSELTRPVFFQRDGSLLVWHRADKGHAQTLMEKLRALSHIWPSEAAPQSLNAQALSELEPSLASTFEEGVWLPQEGQLDNRQLLDALLHSLTQNNVAMHWNQSMTLSNVLHETQADWVFDCRGMGGKPDWSALRGVRGEVIRLHAPEVSLRRPVRLMHPRYPLYIAPKPDHVYVIGATEIESEDTSPASVRSTLELLSAAYSLHSGFAEARVLEISTQLRPALPHHKPSFCSPTKRCLQINGLYRHGFLMAPALLDAAMGWMKGDTQLAQRFGLIESP